MGLTLSFGLVRILSALILLMLLPSLGMLSFPLISTFTNILSLMGWFRLMLLINLFIYFTINILFMFVEFLAVFQSVKFFG